MGGKSRDRVETNHSTEAAVDALLAASRALVAVSARSIAGTDHVTLPQFRMLVVLSQTATNLSGLARSLDVAPSTAMRMVDRLVGSGLVDRHVPPENRRETKLSLTASGEAVVRKVTERRRRDLAAVVAELPEDELDDLARAMALFASAADVLWPITQASLADRLL
jgi:DNA-binding MarR family transcriptional regulator